MTMHDVVDMQAGDYEAIIDRTGFDPGTLAGDRADQHFAVLDSRQQVRARCSIWWRDTGSLGGTRTGAVGHYAATDEPHGRVLLDHACRALRHRGCAVAVGPMDGNTWRRYRFVTDRGSTRPFFLEPANPDDYPVHFRRNGFSPIANYVSEINHSIATRQPELGSLREKLASRGVRIAPIDPRNADADLDGIYDVANESFADAFLFTPLERRDFHRMYAPLLREVDPRLMLVARAGGKVVGFVFAPPDLLQLRYQEEIEAIVIKTVAIRPHGEWSGLGRVLIVDVLGNAIRMGYTKAISALMHIDNKSQKISRACARPMRRYELFARCLNG